MILFTPLFSVAMWNKSSTTVRNVFTLLFSRHLPHKRVASVLEFFIEGGRSRSGKILRPKMGLLSVITNTVLDGGVDDALVVPVAISYDKVPASDLVLWLGINTLYPLRLLKARPTRKSSWVGKRSLKVSQALSELPGYSSSSLVE